MTLLDRAVYAAAWKSSAFGVDPEIRRILDLWAYRRTVPFESFALILAYVRWPEQIPRLGAFSS